MGRICKDGRDQLQNWILEHEILPNQPPEEIYIQQWQQFDEFL
jgi:hypothetical protein